MPATSPPGQPSGRRTARHAAMGASTIALAAYCRLTLPGLPVPLTLQSVAVLALGIGLGPGRAVAAVTFYLALGALGTPIFAYGAGGLAALYARPSAGYLWGFLPAAWLAGQGQGKGASRRLGWLGLASYSILLAGGGGLALHLGARDAWQFGIRPYLGAALVKALLVAAGASLPGLCNKSTLARPAGYERRRGEDCRSPTQSGGSSSRDYWGP